MNNPKSTVLGWASLVAAAGVSYYWAKQTIDERRAQQAADGSRPTEILDWRQRIEGASTRETAASVPVKNGQGVPPDIASASAGDDTKKSA